MAFALHENAAESKLAIPYLLNIQHDLCRGLSTRIVVPVLSDKPVNSGTDFVLALGLHSMTVYAVISHLAAVPATALGDCVADCSAYYDQIRNTVDRLFVGF